MKSLDEVIKAYEICIGYYCSNAEHDVCPYFGESDMGCMKEPEKDALHYLKEYQAILPLVPSLINTAIEVQRIRQGKTIG